MVRDTNAEQAFAGEASSSRRKRQRLPPIVEEEGENDGRGTAAVNRNIAGDEVITEEVRSGTLFDLDLLDCPVCFHALMIPIFQCDYGHIACSSCCVKVRNKCPSCTLPIGNYRCRIMERVVEAIIVPCPNAKHGCTEKSSYGNELLHEKECSFALCYCPEPDCNYTSVYKDLYRHYNANHSKTFDHFTFGFTNDAWLHISDKILVLQGNRDSSLVAVQCFQETDGVYVTVKCIAPSAPGVGEFSYDLTYEYGGNSMSIGSREMNRIQKVNFHTRGKEFMLIPQKFLGQRDSLKMKICIRRRPVVERE